MFEVNKGKVYSYLLISQLFSPRFFQFPSISKLKVLDYKRKYLFFKEKTKAQWCGIGGMVMKLPDVNRCEDTSEKFWAKKA